MPPSRSGRWKTPQHQVVRFWAGVLLGFWAVVRFWAGVLLGFWAAVGFWAGVLLGFGSFVRVLGFGR